MAITIDAETRRPPGRPGGLRWTDLRPQTGDGVVVDVVRRASRALLGWCTKRSIPFIYASSASVYGNGRAFGESRDNEAPLNVYGYSKFLFDQWVRRELPRATAQVAGFRYFDVYGPREAHKGRMASVAFHFFNQYRADGRVKLFGAAKATGRGSRSATSCRWRTRCA